LHAESGLFSFRYKCLALTEQEWLEAEYDFNALFVGPQTLKAAPFASVYLEEDALANG
jgi:TorA maturation chaperone TorD